MDALCVGVAVNLLLAVAAVFSAFGDVLKYGKSFSMAHPNWFGFLLAALVALVLAIPCLPFGASTGGTSLQRQPAPPAVHVHRHARRRIHVHRHPSVVPSAAVSPAEDTPPAPGCGSDRLSGRH